MVQGEGRVVFWGDAAEQLAGDLAAGDPARRVWVEQQDHRRGLFLSFVRCRRSLRRLYQLLHALCVACPGGSAQGVASRVQVDGAEHGAGVGGALDDDEGAEARFFR